MTAAEDVQQHLAGVDGAGNQLPEAKVAMFYPAHTFGLSKDYAFVEGSNESSARYDQISSLAKLLTRTKTLKDGNTYDLWDAIMTLAKAEVLANPHINDDEPLSVNYKAPGA